MEAAPLLAVQDALRKACSEGIPTMISMDNGPSTMCRFMSEATRRVLARAEAWTGTRP